MPKNAREGAQHWNKQVGELRARCKEWKWKEHLAEAFEEQARESHRKRYRAQKECLLLRLQLAADDGLVVPALGATAAEGFCGWLGFVVAPGEADRRRAGTGFAPSWRACSPRAPRNRRWSRPSGGRGWSPRGRSGIKAGAAARPSSF